MHTCSRGSRVLQLGTSLMTALLLCCVLLVFSGERAQAAHTDTNVPGSLFTWLGNSYCGGNTLLHVADYVDDCYVTASGRMYTIGYDEGQSNANYFDANGQEYRIGHYVGHAITVEETGRYVYMATGIIAGGTGGVCITDSLWADPTASSSTLLIIRSALSGIDCSQGIAARNGEVYVSDSTHNLIRVWNRDLTSELRTFAFTRPGKITVDSAGNLWIIQRAGSGQYAIVRCFSKTGTFLRDINDQNVVPTGLAIDNNGYLMVCDDSVHQQIRFYKNLQTTPVLDHTFGVDGGIYASAGATTRGMYGDGSTVRLSGPVGVGMDAAGNLYVANGGGGFAVNITSYDPSGKLRWWRYGLQDFVDTAVQDSNSEADVYTADDHHKLNWNKANGQEAIPVSFTADRFHYPSDMRLNLFSNGDLDDSGNPTVLGVKTVLGHQLMATMSGTAHDLCIYRRGTAADGEMWIPCAWINMCCMIKDSTPYPPYRPIIPDTQNGDGTVTVNPERWIWTDLNGDGAFQANEYEQLPMLGILNFQFDDNGDIWIANGTLGKELQRMPLQGFTAGGAPRYTGASAQVIPLPGTLHKVNQIVFTPSTGVMYLMGSTNFWVDQGTHLVKLTNWNNPPGTNYNQIAWQSDEIPGGKPIAAGYQTLSAAGDFIFSAYLKQSWPDVYRASDGSYVGTLPVPSNMQPVGWLDQKQGMHAFHRANGEYDIYMEEDICNKAYIFRWNPVKVALTSPKDGGSYPAGSNISLAATTTANDGAITNVKFYNGRTLLYTDTTSPYSYTWRAVPAGTYTVSAVALDAHGNTSTDKATITVSSAAGTGLKGCYYNGSSFPTDLNAVPALCRTDANVNFNWAAGSPCTGVNADNFLVRWTGYVKPTVTGTYTFYTSCDDGERLWVNGQPITNDWTSTTTERSGTISLTANQFYKIELEYYESTGNASAVLSWSASGVTKAPIPQSALYPPTGSFDLAPAVNLTGLNTSLPYNAGSPITLTATANDLDGGVSKVEFYQGTTLLGTDTDVADGCSCTWASPATGSYTITARAYDTGGNITKSEPITIAVTIAPTVSLTTPTRGQTFAPGNITLSATAADSDGTISKVAFYRDATLVATDTTSPYSVTWTGATAGNYDLTAVATDNTGAKTTSAIVPIVVSTTTVAVTTPTNGSAIAYGQDVPITATATDAAGVTKVEFFVNGTKIGEDTTSADGWSCTWPKPFAGTYDITAKATKTGGTVTTSVKNTVTLGNANTLCYYDFEDSVNPFQAKWGAYSPGAIATVPSPTSSTNKAWTFGPIGSRLTYTVTSGSAATDILPATNLADMSPNTMWQSGDGYLNNIPANQRYLTFDLGASKYVSYVRVINGSRDNSVNGRITAHFALYVDDIAPGGAHSKPVQSYYPLLYNDASDSEYLVANKTGRYVTIVPIDVWDDNGTVQALGTARFSLGDVRIVSSHDSMATLTLDSNNNTFAQHVMHALNLPVNSTPVQFRVSYKVKRLTTGDVDSKGSIQLNQLEPYLNRVDGGVEYPPAFPYMIPYFGMGNGYIPSYYNSTLGGNVWATMDPSVNNSLLFTVVPRGAGTYNRAQLTLEFAIGGGGVATESFAIDELRFEEIAPSPANIALTSPLNGAVYTPGQVIPIVATASQGVYGIAKVQYYDGANLISEDYAAPYTFDWTSAAGGQHTITAKAVDATGNVTTSSAVSVTVQSTRQPQL